MACLVKDRLDDRTRANNLAPVSWRLSRGRRIGNLRRSAAARLIDAPSRSHCLPMIGIAKLAPDGEHAIAGRPARAALRSSAFAVIKSRGTNSIGHSPRATSGLLPRCAWRASDHLSCGSVWLPSFTDTPLCPVSMLSSSADLGSSDRFWLPWTATTGATAHSSGYPADRSSRAEMNLVQPCRRDERPTAGTGDTLQARSDLLA